MRIITSLLALSLLSSPAWAMDEDTKILCPNEVINYMNSFEDYSVCSQIRLPARSDITLVKRLRFTTHFTPGFPSDKAILIRYEKDSEIRHRVYIYGLDNPDSWDEITDSEASNLLDGDSKASTSKP